MKLQLELFKTTRQEVGRWIFFAKWLTHESENAICSALLMTLATLTTNDVRDGLAHP